MIRQTGLALIAVSVALSAQQDRGRRQYVECCAACHGADARGGERAPEILSRLSLRDDAGLAELIRDGLPGAGMPGTRMDAAGVKDLVAWLRTLRPPMTPLRPPREVKNVNGRDWPTYHGDPGGNRYSDLSEIAPANVKKLRVAWMYSAPGWQRLEVTPVVVDGVMYVTSVNEVHALDAGSGEPLWRYRRPRTKGLVGDAAGGINRGVAVSGGRLFMVTDNAHLLALNRRSGALLWDVEMADYRQNYGATAAPLVVGDLVISGTSGGDEGIRGFLAAYRVSNGERIWRFWTIPLPGEPLASTWQGTALLHGCASTWMTGTYDAQLDLLFWTTGNPCPDYNGDQRRGDNLYSDSVLALRPKTGELAWHYQFTPHDLHDWDAQQTPMVVDDGPRKLLVQANRNGFFYVLDRTKGKLLLARPFVQKLTWAREIGTDGRPLIIPEANPSREGTKACPAVEGATNWFSTAYHPALRLFFVQALEKCSVYVKEPGQWEAGKSYYDGATHDVPGEPGQKVLRALDLDTGRVVWESPQTGPANSWGGVLATASGLLFAAEDGGDFVARDARTGARLWKFSTHQVWKASPMTYRFDGRQYVAVAAGGTILAFSLPED